jgi:RNA polymerase sigma-70 factor (ECF subfamily)
MQTISTHPSLFLQLAGVDDGAWFRFERRYGGFILRYCVGRGLSLMDAEDVRQKVLVSLMARFTDFRYEPDRGRFRDYLGRTVRNALIRHATRSGPAMESLEYDVEDERPHPVDEIWETEWRRHHLRLAIETVRRTFDPRSVEIFERLLAGEAPAETGRRLGVSRDVVYKVKQRVGDRIRELIREQAEREDWR